MASGADQFISTRCRRATGVLLATRTPALEERRRVQAGTARAPAESAATERQGLWRVRTDMESYRRAASNQGQARIAPLTNAPAASPAGYCPAGRPASRSCTEHGRATCRERV